MLLKVVSRSLFCSLVPRPSRLARPSKRAKKQVEEEVEEVEEEEEEVRLLSISSDRSSFHFELILGRSDDISEIRHHQTIACCGCREGENKEILTR